MTEQTWLREGKYARHAEREFEIARKTREVAIEKGLSVLESARRYVDLILEEDKNMPKNRSSSQIIESRKYNGCRERATVILPILRLNNIPCEYVETLSLKWLANPNPNKIKGHAFVNVLTEGLWRVFDPKAGLTPGNQYVLRNEGFRVLGKGIDFSEVNIEGDDEVKTYDLTDLHAFLKERGYIK